MMFCMWEVNLFSFLNRNAAQFFVGTIRELCTAVQVEEISEQLHRWFFLKVDFVEYLKVAYIGHGVRSNILWMELEACEDIPEEFLSGGTESPV